MNTYDFDGINGVGGTEFMEFFMKEKTAMK